MRYRCQALPLPDEQVSFLVEGRERLRWHFNAKYPRPFFYPLNGPRGLSLTRMGHPGAPNHDHHRSVWFAHHKVLGIDFWSDTGTSKIRQRQWLAYHDGDDFAGMAVVLDWLDGHDPQPLIEQQLAVAVMAGPREGETLVEIATTFRPVAERLELGMSNFGFLAVRVAKEISGYFGGGQLHDSEGRRGEKEIFNQPARWVDYSGTILKGDGDESDQPISEGVTLFEHPSNFGYPHRWHVREDGWMGPSQCREAPLELKREEPLELRFLLHAHGDRYADDRAVQLSRDFAQSKRLLVEPSNKPHTSYVIQREGE